MVVLTKSPELVRVRSMYTVYLANYMGSFWKAENLYLGVNDHQKANAGIDKVRQVGQDQVHVPHVPGDLHGKRVGY